MSRKILNRELNRWIRRLSDYTDIPIRTVRKECTKHFKYLIIHGGYQDIWDYFDCKSIDLMMEYECGWWQER